MAKKKSASSTRRKTASGSKRKPAVKSTRRKASTVRKPTSRPKAGRPAPQGAAELGWSNHQIGLAAGEVWQLLTDRGAESLAALQKAADAPDDLVLAAVGWLARENKLEFLRSGRTVKVALREEVEPAALKNL